MVVLTVVLVVAQVNAFALEPLPLNCSLSGNGPFGWFHALVGASTVLASPGVRAFSWSVL